MLKTLFQDWKFFIMMRGVNDLHIAGHARSLALTLVSNNIKKIISVEGLRLRDWAKNP